jgi:hypothetical protein
VITAPGKVSRSVLCVGILITVLVCLLFSFILP